MDETGVVTLGGRSYAVERDFVRPPPDLPLGFVSQVAVDSEGRLHVLHRGRPAVVVFAPDGGYLGHYAEASIVDPHGIYCSPDDRLLVADRDAHQVVVLTSGGEELFRLGERHRPRWEEPFNHPTDAAVAPDGRIFVSDGYGNGRVHRFAADGRHGLSWGRVGRGPGEFMTPHAVWVDRDGRVLVVDRENGRVQVFDADGGLLAVWEGFHNPMDVWLDAEGLAYVTDQIPSLHLMASDGRRLGRCRPALNGAHGLFGDRAGNLYLAEIQPSRITRLRLL
jgi:peptidylglycine monooxygenase